MACRVTTARGRSTGLVPFRAIAEAIGRGLDLPARSIPAEKATDPLGGFVGMISQVDNLTSSARTREVLGWKPARRACSKTSPSATISKLQPSAARARTASPASQGGKFWPTTGRVSRPGLRRPCPP